jgi:hypothetical protein
MSHIWAGTHVLFPVVPQASVMWRPVYTPATLLERPGMEGSETRAVQVLGSESHDLVWAQFAPEQVILNPNHLWFPPVWKITENREEHLGASPTPERCGEVSLLSGVLESAGYKRWAHRGSMKGTMPDRKIRNHQLNHPPKKGLLPLTRHGTKSKGVYHELNYVPPSSHVKALPFNGMAFGNGAFGRRLG